MKKVKVKLTIAVLFLGSLVAIGQAAKEDKSSSVGNGKAMEENLNFPNAINPADNNNQGYERCGVMPAYIHPDVDMSNKYNRGTYDKH
jgi:hypothetical protein